MKAKKSKRIISLVLALTMIFTFMAMSASAATTEVQPRASYCPQCGGLGFQHWKTYYHTEDCTENNVNGYYSCPSCPGSHAHFDVRAEIYSRCATCGYTEVFQTITSYCPYGF